MVFGALRLLREALDVLLESTPREINLSKIDSAMLGVEGVEGIHDLHVWSLTSGVHALSGHLRVQPERLAQADRIINEARQLLKSDFRITHTTLQVESETCGEVVCVLAPSELTDSIDD
jgi:cobalt-zinc-cadmium efflux system protein